MGNSRNATIPELKQIAADLHREIEELCHERDDLQKALEIHRGLTDAARDCLFAKDAQRRYTFMNPAGVALLGVPLTDILGRTPEEVYPPEAAEIIAELDGLNLQGQPVDAVRSLSFRGQKITLHVLQAPHVDAAGNITGISGAARDVTDLLQSMDRLHESQKLESIGTVAATIAHEFRNFLGVILGHAELGLAGSPKGTDNQIYFREIVKAAHRTRDLVGQILHLSHPNRTLREELSVGELIEDAVDYVRGMIPPSIRLKIDIPDPKSVIMVCRTHFCQILLNLCTNAVHAMEDERGIITIRQHPAVPAGEGAVRISVSDSGSGIPAEHLSRIFDPFFSTKPTGRGTGIGLAVVADLMKRQHGSISVESTIGQGTTFTLTFPKHSLLLRGDEIEACPGQVSGFHRHRSLMVVDDEPLFTELVSLMADKIGWSTECFNDSREALATFKQAPQAFHMVLTDLVMPGLPGDKLIESIHRLRPELPVILCSAFLPQEETLRQQFSCSARAISKPLSFEVFSATINELSPVDSIPVA